jgi:hypothetical protein
VRVHSLALSYTPKNMRCDSRASLLACTLASPCLGHEPKAKVATLKEFKNIFAWTYKDLKGIPLEIIQH